ncbi:MAG: rRNA maturation RNase YbeY [Bacteroidales bacterium]|nr:rRNA maturation RNase YbeY [Bacteroidales bacterium]
MILFHSSTNFKISNKKILKSWIKSVCADFNKQVTDLNFIFMSDEELLQMNIKYLNHDYYTDVITFNYCEDDIISGDVYISVDRVKENALSLNQSFLQELYRVIIHGVLHLLGFEDHSIKEKLIMRDLENRSLQSDIISKILV